MKKLLLLYCISISFAVFSQVGVKMTHIRPTGSLGMTMKPTIGAELLYKPFEEESGFNVRMSIGFAKFTPRQDTFPSTGVIVSQGTTVTPGWIVIQKYNITTLNMGLDYMFFLNDQIRLYPGLDVGVLFTGLAYQSYTPLISSEGYSGGYVFLSTRFRIGGEFLLTEDLGVFSEISRALSFSPEVGGMSYNEYAVGMRYNF